MTYSMNDFFSSVEKFVNISEPENENLEEAIDLWLSLNFEENTEAITAFEEGDNVGLLDGAIDQVYTGLGLLIKLHKAGFKVKEGLQRVGENNLTKFPTTEPNMSMYPDGWVKTYNEEYNVWIIKDSLGKVRKPLDYHSVNLQDLAPSKINNKE